MERNASGHISLVTTPSKAGEVPPRGGSYYRVCKPDWTDCTDTTFSLRGRRWNAPGTYRILYLNRTLRMAALQAVENFRGEAHSLFDLRPERRPQLQLFDVPRADYLDVVTDEGIVSRGLPISYPEGAGWEECQEIGRAAYENPERGIACRTACADGGDPDHEELALFDHGGLPATPGEQLTFDCWFPTGGV